MQDLSQYKIITWPEYLTYTQKLAEQILPVRNDIDRIIGIARSGLTLGHILSDLIQKPISIFGAKSYIEFGKQGSMRITQDITINLSQERILLVDSIAETGKTLEFTTNYIHELNTQKIVTATIFYSPESKIKPNYFVEEFSDRTIVMPHEFTEFVLEQMQDKSPSEQLDIKNELKISDSQFFYISRLM